MYLLPSSCEEFQKINRKHKTLSLVIYNFYFNLALGAINGFHFIQASYLGHDTPQATFREIIGNKEYRDNCWKAIFLVGVVAILAYLKFINRKQYTIESYCYKRYFMAGALIWLNVLFAGKSIIGLYSSWASELVTKQIFAIMFYLAYRHTDLFAETESPIHYSLPKATKITDSQKQFMIFFFTITGAFFIGLSFTKLDQFPDEYEGLAFYYTTRYFCPAINILAIPVVYVAFLAYNSDEFEFSGVEPTSGRFWYGVCRWNEKLGEWDYVETVSNNKRTNSLPSKS